jgi:hypothetical protein
MTRNEQFNIVVAEFKKLDKLERIVLESNGANGKAEFAECKNYLMGIIDYGKLVFRSN